jgi:hypothetical protein
MVSDSLLNAVKFGKAWFDETEKTKGQVNLFVEELKENARFIEMGLKDGLSMDDVAKGIKTEVYIKLKKQNLDFNKLQSAKIEITNPPNYSNLLSWHGKTTSELVESIYDKLNDIKTMYPLLKESSNRMWGVRVRNLHFKLQQLEKHLSK